MQCGTIQNLAHIGLKKLEFQEKLTAKDDELDVELDSSYASWNEVAGKRKDQTFIFLRNTANIIMLIIFLVTDESSRYITHQLLYWAHKPHETRQAGGPASLLTFYKRRARTLTPGSV